MADQVFGAKCGFWDAVNYDRTYSADDMNKPYNRLVSDGVFAANDGSASTDLQVFASGTSKNISVSKGAGIFSHKWFENPGSLIITVPDNTSINPRIDSVIVQVDRRTSGRVGNIVYRTGTAAADPEPPVINGVTNVIEYRLANIAVGPSVTVISQADITDLRGSAACPWVTGLIQQVDTSTLWTQFQTAYQNQFNGYTADYQQYIELQRQAWEDFLSTLTEELTVSTNVVSFTSVYNTLGTVTDIPVDIASYAPATDVLQVYINGLLATPDVDYTIAFDGTSITLEQSLDAGQTVVFVVFKSLIGADIESAVSLIQRVDDKINNFTEDTGWFPLVLESGITAASSADTPMIRMVGSRVQIRGSIKGVSAYNTTISTLPVTLKPAADEVFTSSADDGSGGADQVTITIKADSGDIIVSSGSMAATDAISLSFTYLANYSSNMAMIYRYMGSVSSYANLPTSGVQAGDYYIVQSADADHNISAGDSVLWNGAEWEVFNSSISAADIDAIIDTI